MNTVTNGDRVRKELATNRATEEDGIATAPKTAKYSGMWVYDFNPGLGYTEANGYQRRCKQRGPDCNQNSIFKILGIDHTETHKNWFVDKTDADILALVNNAT